MFAKLKNTSFINQVVKFYNSQIFVVVLAAIIFASSIFGLEFLAFGFITLSIVFVGLFSADSKPIIPMLLLVVFAVSPQHMPGCGLLKIENPDYLTTTKSIIVLTIMSCLILFGLLFYLVSNKSLKTMFTRRNRLTFGLVMFAFALLLNGVFSSIYSIENLIVGFIEGFAFLAIYTFFITTLDSKTTDYKYFCNIATIAAILIVVQLVFLYVDVYKISPELAKIYINLGWGVSNNIGAVLAILIPPIIYMACSSKKSWLYLLISLLAFLGVISTKSRGAILIATIIYPIVLVFAFIKTKNKKSFAISSIILVVCLAVIVSLFRDNILTVLSSLKNSGLNDNGRFNIYKLGIKNFLQKPIFGVGFSLKTNDTLLDDNFFFHMYHNTIIQLLASCGIIGLIGYVWHRVDSARVLLNRITVERAFMLASILVLLGTSMLDNHIFYFYPMFYYMIQLVLAEKDFNNTINGNPCCDIPKGDKPRILVPLVEAGMGHITSAKAIASAITKKYGDKVEVLCFSFFKASNSIQLLRYEKKLVKFVLTQNKIPIFGKNSMFLTKFFGKRVSLKYVMDGFEPNSYTVACDYLQSFNADMVVSTHWSTAYYAWHLKNRPLVASYCPDATFNVMFDTGNDLLMISTESGAKIARENKDKYNCRIETVQNCLREEIYHLPLDKKINRKREGLDENLFTIVLADGGYGAGKIKSVVNEIIKLNLPILLIAVCGKNLKLFKHFNDIKLQGKTQLKALGFVDNLPSIIACADLFIGKSGAMTMAEPCYFAVPTIISFCATSIEEDIANYYVNEVKSAVKITNPKHVAECVEQFYHSPQLLEKYKESALKVHSTFGAEKAADLVIELLHSKYPNL